MKYEATYACGHTDTVELFGSSRDRERALAAIEKYDLCPECEKKERDEKNAASAAANREQGLPELVGTPKQIAWAETIRAENIAKLAEQMAHLSEDLERSIAQEPEKEDDWRARAVCMDAAYQSVLGATNASWWIDNRSCIDRVMRTDANAYYKQYVATGKLPRMDGPEDAVAEAANDTEIFAPEKADANAEPVVLTVRNDHVVLEYPRDNGFIALVKGLGFNWVDHEWTRNKTAGVASLPDLAAHVANAVVEGGYRIEIGDAATREKIHSNNWTPVNFREIGISMDGQTFYIHYSPDDDVRSTAIRLPRARQGRRTVAVPLFAAEAVADFAETYGYAVSEKAQRAIEAKLAQKKTTIAPNLPDTKSANTKDLRKDANLADLYDN